VMQTSGWSGTVLPRQVFSDLPRRMTTSVATVQRQELIDAIDAASAILAAAEAKEDPARAVDEAIRVLTVAAYGEESAGASRAAVHCENARLREQLAEAQKQLRQREDFLAVVAHELRNPLAPLSFAVGLLLTEAAQGRLPAGEVLLRRLKLVDKQVGRLAADLNRLLDFSRIRSGRLDLTREEVDLAQIVEDVLEEMKPQFDTSRCEIRLSCAGPQKGCWDAMRLRQVVWNLLSNAAKFGAGAPIDVAVAGDEGEVYLTIHDHGSGISEHERERVFKRFERAGSGQRHSGFGIGLWLVKQIVDALGGEIKVDSAPGQGSTFMVALPRNQDA
jgi:signal transduction histidine kinase